LRNTNGFANTSSRISVTGTTIPKTLGCRGAARRAPDSCTIAQRTSGESTTRLFRAA
jgi:hypothetical protein